MGSFMPTTERIRLRQSDYQSSALASDCGVQSLPLWFVAGVHFAGFGLWFCWTLVAVHLHHVGAGLAFMERFSLLAISGLGAGCVGLTLSLGAHPARREESGEYGVMLGWSLFTLLLLSCGLTWLLSQVVAPVWQWQGLALLCGAGAGASSALVHQLRPHSRGQRRVGASDAALLMAVGHWGIVMGLLVLPLLVLLPLPSQGVVSVLWTSHFFARLAPGTDLWLAWSGAFWGAITVLLLAFWLRHQRRGSWCVSVPVAVRSGWYFYRAFFFGLTLAALGAWLVLPSSAGGSGLVPPKELLLAVLIALALVPMLLAARTGRQTPSLDHLRRVDTWALALLWVMSQGSFLGLAAAFPLTVERLFVGSAAPGYPGVFVYAWMLPLLGILVRPLGTWGSARWGGALTTQICIVIMVAASVAAAYWVYQAQGSAQPARYFSGFMLGFALLFVAAGVAQSALARDVEAVASSRAWVWLSAMAAFGVFYICLTLAEQLERGKGVQALAGFALFYALCGVANVWRYVRGPRSALAL